MIFNLLFETSVILRVCFVFSYFTYNIFLNLMLIKLGRHVREQLGIHSFAVWGISVEEARNGGGNVQF